MRGESRRVISLRRIQPIFAIWGCLVSLAAWADAAPTGSLGNAWEDPRNPVLRIFGGQRLDLWSLRPVKLQGVPSVDSLTAEPTTRRSPLDAWLQSGLSRPSELRVPEADSRTLIRRLSLDLAGLPPSVEDVESFERECVQELRSAGGSASQAYERLVDRLLASPRYGEHQARQWLDVIRYSDSNGFDWDEFRPRAWRFRDYVIRAFNADKPFDRFILEQLAGDELLEGPRALSPSRMR